MFHKITFLKKLVTVFIYTFSFHLMSEGISLDGVISPDEWDQASLFDLEYELMPSRNTAAALKTEAYVKFDKKYLYIGINIW